MDNNLFVSTDYSVKVKLSEPLLGTIPLQSSIWKDHFAGACHDKMKKEGLSEAEISERLKQDELDLPAEDEAAKGLTGFLKDENGFYILDSMVRGYLKASAQVLKQYGTIKQLQDKIRKFVFVRPRKIYVAKPDEVLEIKERPLRAQTPMGERVAIARSYMIPEGRELEFKLEVLLDTLPEKLVRGLLEYGQFQGLGQYRTARYGSFEVTQFERIN